VSGAPCGFDAAAPQLDPALRRAADLALAAPPAAAERATALRKCVRDEVKVLFGAVDVLASPATPTTAPPVGMDTPPGHEDRTPVDWSYFTYPFNLTGNPGLSLAVALAANGLPIGLQLVGRAWVETILLRVAAAVELPGLRAPMFESSEG